jgi:hypothetical protein
MGIVLRSIGQSPIEDMNGKASDPVAAHLGQVAIGVRVVHEEVCVHVGRIDSSPPDDPDHAVRPDAKVSIADPSDQLGSEPKAVVQVLDHHEIVPRSVVLREQHQVLSRAAISFAPIR